MKWNKTPLALLAIVFLALSGGGVLAQSSNPVVFEGSSLSVIELDARSDAYREVRDVTGLRFDAELNYVVQSNGLDTIVRFTNANGTTHSVVLKNVAGVNVEQTNEWTRLNPVLHHTPDPDVPVNEECCTCQSFDNFSDDFETGGCVPGCMGCGCEACVCTIGPCGGGGGLGITLDGGHGLVHIQLVNSY